VRAVRGPLPAEAVLEHVGPGADVIVPMANGEPVTLIDALEANAERLERVRIHQMHALHERPYINGAYPGRLHHVSYFLSPATRGAYRAGHCDLVPNHFSEMPALLGSCTTSPVVLAAASPPDRHGHFSLGTNAEYAARFIGRIPFFLEVNARMPRTGGLNQIHVSQVVGWTEVDYDLVEVPPVVPDERDEAIAARIVERIPDRATLQAGIGGIPNAVLASLHGHRDLGIHTELLADGVMDLVEAGVVTGTYKYRRPNKVVTTFALGTRRLYEWMDQNLALSLLPVDEVNDPRRVAQEPRFVSINATTEVDLYGQCASETVAGRYYSSSGGQADFARGAVYSEGGQAFVVLHSTTRKGRSRIRTQLTPGSVVTTLKNTVDNVVTEHGLAELRGVAIAERARRLIAIAAPEHRDELERDAREQGILPRPVAVPGRDPAEGRQEHPAAPAG
jgi:acyl-CoA hydrolase